MAGTVDTQATLETLSKANNDVVELIGKLRAFLTSVSSITFELGTGNITVNSLLKLINDYKKGIFSSIILGEDPINGQVILSADDDGNLKVTDTNGTLVQVQCSKLVASIIENCVAHNVVARSCSISDLVASIGVTGGVASLDSLDVADLKVDTLAVDTLNAAHLTVGSRIVCSSLLSYGARKFVPQNTRTIFERDGGVINDANKSLNVSQHLPGWSIPDRWLMLDSPTHLNPGDAGFIDAGAPGYAQSGVIAGTVLPDMISFRGNTTYDSFDTSLMLIRPWQPPNPNLPRDSSAPLDSGSPLPAPRNVQACVVLQGQPHFIDLGVSAPPELAALLAWPCGHYNLYTPSGNFYVSNFGDTSIGKDIYYKVLKNTWKIYRQMRVTFAELNSQQIVSVTFEGLTELPSYSCSRFIANKYDSAQDFTATGISSRYILYSLDFA